MTLVLGARHVVTGTGQFAIANPIGIAIALAGIPNYVARDPGTPLRYHRLGRVQLGTAVGWRYDVDLVANPQLLFPLPGEDTVMGYTLLAGCTATIDEVASSSRYAVRPMPWDRSPTPWQQSAVAGLAAAQADIAGFTYTVPASRILMLSSLSVTIARTAVATTPGLTVSYAIVGSDIVAYTTQRDNVMGPMAVGQLSAGPLYLPAGTSIAWHYSRTETTGGQWCQFFAAGTLFDA